MKQKREHILKNFLIFGIALLLASCSEELFDEAIESSNKRAIKEVKFNELYKDTKFKNLLEKVSHTSNAARTSFENQNGFTISDGFVKVIETDSVISYTMLIERDVVTDTISFENLVIQENKFSASEKAHCIKYTPTTIEPSGHNSFYYEGTEELKSLAFTGFNRVGENAIETLNCFVQVTQLWCSQPFPGSTQHHIAGPKCTNASALYFRDVSIYSPEDCSTNSGGTGTPGSNGPPQDSTEPGNTGGTTSPVLPNQGFGPINEFDTPCQNLKNLINPSVSDLKLKIDSLKQKIINNVPNEWSTSFKRTRGIDMPYTYTNTNLEQGPSNGEVDFWTGTYYFGSCHTHPKGKHPLFSWGDLYSILETWKKTKDSNKDVVVVMIVAYDKNNPSQPLVYAMTINDMSTLEAKLNEDLAATEGANIDAKRKKLNEKQGEMYDIYKNNLEKYFLQKYSSYGISLYKANEDVSNWSKLDLAPGTGINGSVVLPEPCN